jgi:hypothetical protein
MATGNTNQTEADRPVDKETTTNNAPLPAQQQVTDALLDDVTAALASDDDSRIGTITLFVLESE